MRLRNILESFSNFDDEDLALPAQRFADYKSAYLDLYDKVKSDNQIEKTSILADVDFELELIHRDVINVQYILSLLAQLYDAEESDQDAIRKLVLDSVAGDLELRSKRELIEKFIEENLPKATHAAEIPDCFEDFWEKERTDAFKRLVKEEQLDADKLQKVIDRYVYTGQEPLDDPDIVSLIDRPSETHGTRPSPEAGAREIARFRRHLHQGRRRLDSRRGVGDKPYSSLRRQTSATIAFFSSCGSMRPVWR